MVVLCLAGVAVVGFFRSRRVFWQDIAEVELSLRTGGSDSGRCAWPSACTTAHHAGYRPSSTHRGSEEIPPPGERTRYGQVFHRAHAPRELARLHHELRQAWCTRPPHPHPPSLKGQRQVRMQVR